MRRDAAAARLFFARAHSAGVPLGRDHPARLMRQLHRVGVRRGKPKRTTIADTAAARPAGLVRRQFSAGRPNQLSGSDQSEGID
jgi:putative transposase